MISVFLQLHYTIFHGVLHYFFKIISNLNQLQTLIFSGFDMGFVFGYGETKIFVILTVVNLCLSIISLVLLS
jgi:hypothetical protein